MPEASPGLLGEQMRRSAEMQDRMQARLDRVRDDSTILTGTVMRVDAGLQGLAAEVRALHRQRAAWSATTRRPPAGSPRSRRGSLPRRRSGWRPREGCPAPGSC